MKKKILLFGVLVLILMLCTIAASAEPVFVSDINELQSEHPYSNNMDKTWVYTHQTDVENVGITFSNDTETESNCDYIYVYDGNDNQIGKYTGTELANRIIIVPGNIIKIRLTSDGSVTRNGFTVTNVKENMSQSDIILAEGTCGESLTWTLDSEGTLTISGTGEMTNWDSYSSVPWYNNRSKIKSVVIGDEVTTIEEYAFRDCTGLTTLTIGSGVTSIERGAFYNCTGLTQINWNAKNVSDFSYENYVFYKAGQNGEGINVVFGDNVETIPAYCFYPYSSDYSPKIISVTIGESVTSIGYRAFYNCESLTSVTVDENNPNYSSEDGVLFNKDKTTLIQCLGGKTGEYIIPDSVTSIGDGAFSSCTGLTSVTIPDSVTSIGGSAFSSCTGLTSVTIPDSVTSIGNYAFYNCTGLTQINWNAKNVSDFSYENYVFYKAGQNGEGINVVFGDNVEKIPAYCFYPYSNSDYSPKIISVTIGESVTSIGEYAFIYCTGLTSVTIPDSVTSIGNSAFYDCTGLTSVTIPDSVTSIGEDAFEYCTGLTSVTIGEGVTSIGSYAFRNCTGLTQINWNAKNVSDFDYSNYVFAYAGKNGEGINVVFGDNVETIPSYCFCPYGSNSSYSPKIISVTIGDSVTSIGYRAFDDCTGLTSVTIPDTPVVIGRYAFDNTAYYNNSENWDNGWLYINNHLISADKTIASAEVREGTITIAAYAFSENKELLRVTLPDSLEIISGSAFSGCNNLLKINIPKKVSYIGSSAFYNCSSIRKIDIPSSVKNIGSEAFYYCNSLEGVYVTDIDAWCDIEFGNYSSNPLNYANNLYINDKLAEDITISNKITKLNDYAFYNCDSIKTVNLPDSITSIGIGAFYNCDALANINIPESVTSIGGDAFYYCNKLKNIYITDLSAWCKIPFGDYDGNPLNRGTNLYLNGKLLEELVIPDDITVLNNYTFYNCDSLKSVILHDKIDKVEENVFYGCDNLKYVVIPKDIFYIKNNSFYNCNNIGYVFYKGSKSLWDDVLIYAGNDSINNATIICDAKEKTYKFVTNHTTALGSVTTYCIAESPNIIDENQVLSGWYDNASLSGEPVSFPYCGNATTLYASWKKRTGQTTDNAIYLKANETNTRNFVRNEQVYYEFTPKSTGKYEIVITSMNIGSNSGGNNNYNVNLCNKNGNYINSDSEFEAGETYYLIISCYSDLKISVTVKGEEVVLKGDILADGKINAKDAVKLAQYLAKWDIRLTDSEMLAADVVADEKINAKDAVKLAQYLAKWDITLE